MWFQPAFSESTMAENGDDTEQDFSFGDDSVVYGHDPGDSVEGEDTSIGGDGEGGEDPVSVLSCET